MPNLFNYNLIRTYIKNHQIDDYDQKMKVIQKWKSNLATIKGVNEKALQAAFLQGIFGKLLGYKGITEANGTWNMNIEPSTEIDATAPDSSLGFYSDEEQTTQAVIELKSPKDSLDKKQKRGGKEYGTPVDQAFSYASKYDHCKWVIVSNMIEIRIYKVGRSQEYYEAFHIEELDNPDQLIKFHLLLCKANLIREDGNSLTHQLSEKTKDHIEDISVQFYNLYKQIRIALFEELKQENPEFDQELLLEKAQKFIDRIIFICFCEDLGLLPNNLLHEAIQRGKKSFSTSEYVIWDEVRGIFRAIDKGSQKHNIPEYDGGLFQYDEVLDELKIKNDFFDTVFEISAHDFNSDLDVNILGHIFEQSIADIEELKANIQNQEYDAQYSSRKKDGIYYTPTYITRYIVENSVGKYLEQIKKDLGENELPDLETASTPQVKGRYKKRLLKFYKEYEEKLKDLKILDPACGSGAFLNQAFDFLLEEYKWIQDQISFIQDGKKTIFQQEPYQRSILKDNLYGVDLNEESVEITKLSLWLKTANRRKPLTNLDENIKCGNSLIDDPEVAGDKAFCWEDEFPLIMKKGGFDVVIGNPPYVVLNPKMLNKYHHTKGNNNTYVAFIGLSSRISKPEAIISFIIPTTWFSGETYESLRDFLLSQKTLLQLIQLPYDIFQAYIDTVIMIYQNKKASDEKGVKVYRFPIKAKQENINLKTPRQVKRNIWLKNLGKTIFLDVDILKIKEKYDDKKSVKLGDIATVNRGTLPPKKEMFVPKESPNAIRWFNGQVYRYIKTAEENQIYVDPKLLKENKPLKLFESTKILGRQLVSRQFRLMFTYTEEEFAFKKNLYAIILEKDCFNPYYLLSILNSAFYSFVQIKSNPSLQRDDYPSFSLQDYKYFKIPIISTPKQKSFEKKAKDLTELKKQKEEINQLCFIQFLRKYSSLTGSPLKSVLKKTKFFNPIYSGRAKKLRKLSATISDTILTVYAETNNRKLELMKFDEKDPFRIHYLKLFFENLTEEKIEEINNGNGNIFEKVLALEIPDFEKPLVIRKVVTEWNKIQEKHTKLKTKIAKTDNKIDQMVYELYGLNEDEIKIVEESVKGN